MSTNYYETAVQEDLDVGTGTAEKRAPGGGTHTGTQISLSTFGQGQAATTDTWDTGTIAASSYAAKDITVSGAALGDFVMASLSVDVQDMILDAEVTATNTVTLVLSNPTGSGIDIGTPTAKVLVFKVR